MQVKLHEISVDYGDAGIEQTVHAMIALMQQGAALPVVKNTAAEICASAPKGETRVQSDLLCAAALRQWIADRWRFVDDPEVAELLYGADAQLGLIAEHGAMFADCDDAAILFGALGLAAGLVPRVICVGFLTNSAPYTHTWVELRSPLGVGTWLEGDVTRAMQRIPLNQIGRAAAWEVQA